jgi:hypothetical protein
MPARLNAGVPGDSDSMFVAILAEAAQVWAEGSSIEQNPLRFAYVPRKSR